MIYRPTSKQIDAATKFAKAHDDNYGKDGQTDLSVKEAQKLYGKLCEFAAEAYCIARGLHIDQGPDCVVYGHARRGWDPDLIVSRPGTPGDFRIQVKGTSERSARRYGLSVTFQHGKNRKDPHRFDIVVLVVAMDNGDYLVVGHADKERVMPLLRDPKLQHLIGEKLCLYYSDLVDKWPDEYDQLPF